MRDGPTAFIESLAARRRFGMRPGLDSIRSLCSRLGNPQDGLRAVHVAGTNGKGAVCAMLSAALCAAESMEGRCAVGLYTSPHLLALNERFRIDGEPVDDAELESAAKRVEEAVGQASETTFFEALTAVAFVIFAKRNPRWTVLECGLGGRLDATNICSPAITVITRVGLDHCQWLGSTVEAIATEKCGIIKPGVPVVLGRNDPSVRAVAEARAAEVGAPFHYAPDEADESEIPADFSLAGKFNRENAVTAIAALKVLSRTSANPSSSNTSSFFLLPSSFLQLPSSFSRVVWPGRFQKVGNFIIDGAHNPPGAKALAEALDEAGLRDLNLIAGFCSDKDVSGVLSELKPVVKTAMAVRTGNSRSLTTAEAAAAMKSAGMDASECSSLGEAVNAAGTHPTLICGSLFLVGEALEALGAYPWRLAGRDASEILGTPAMDAKQ